MSVPLSISAAIAAPEQASISGIDETAQKAERETSTVDLAVPPQAVAPELNADTASLAEEEKQKEAPEVGSATQQESQPSDDTSAEDLQAVSTPDVEHQPVEQPSQQDVPAQEQNIQSPASSTGKVEQQKTQNTPVAATEELHLEGAGQQDNGDQPAGAHNDDHPQGDLDKDKGEVAEDQAPSSEEESAEDHSEGGGLDKDEDEAAEDDAEEEPDTPPKFTPNGPSLDVRDVAPETDYTIRVGDNERTYTTDFHGSAGINIVDD